MPRCEYRSFLVGESLGQVCGPMLVGLPALLEAEALSVQLQDMDMVGEAVEKGPSEPFRAKDFGPLIEGQVGSSQDRAAFIALAEYRAWAPHSLFLIMYLSRVNCHVEAAFDICLYGVKFIYGKSQ